MDEKILELEGIMKKFSVEKGIFRKKVGEIAAVDNVSFTLEKGKVLGLVGESGSGKTTLGKIIVGLYSPDSGKMTFSGKNLLDFSRIQRATNIQMIFQNPFASLNPRLSVHTILREVVKNKLKISGETKKEKEIGEEIENILNTVGLSGDILDSYPHQFSGGQRQRIGLARALLMRPEIIVADEPVSSLDISIQAQILNLFMELKEKFSLSYIFISHDMAVVNFVSDDIMIMQRGRIIEKGETRKIISSPEASYTKELLEAVPRFI